MTIRQTSGPLASGLSRDRRTAVRRAAAWLFGLAVGLAAGYAAAGEPARVLAARVGLHPGMIRVVLELSSRVAVDAAVQSGPPRVELTLPATMWQGPDPPRGGRGVIRGMSRSDAGGDALRVTVELGVGVRVRESFYLSPQDGFPTRYVLDLDLESPTQETARDAPQPAQPQRLASAPPSFPAAPPTTAFPKEYPLPAPRPRQRPSLPSSPPPDPLPEVNLPVRRISPALIVEALHAGNTDLQAARIGVSVSRAAITQTEGAFDVNVTSSLSYQQRHTNHRTALIGRLRDQDAQALNEEEQRRAQQEQSENENNDSPPEPTRNKFCSPVEIDGALVPPVDSRCFLPPEYSERLEYATGDSLIVHSVTGSVGLAMQFPFGGSINASLGTTWRRKYAPAPPPGLTSPAYPTDDELDPYGFGQNYFWTSNASVSLTMPLPYTKGFGREGATPSYLVNLARSNERRAIWAEKGQENRFLEAALLAYWDLVAMQEELRIRANHKQVLDQRLTRLRQNMDRGQVTDYDVMQVRSAIVALEDRMEVLRHAYAVTSNQILTLMGGERGILLRPVHGERELADPFRLDVDSIVVRSVDDHAEMRIAQEDHEASRLTLAYRKNQDRLDLSLIATASVGENDTGWGFNTMGAALAHLIRPDTANLYIGIRLRIPFGGNATGGAFDRARISEKQAFDRMVQTRNTLSGQIQQAVGSFLSAQRTDEQRRSDLDLAMRAYDHAQDMRDFGESTEFEVLNRLSDILDARLGRISAQIGLRKAHIQLLAAQGLLEAESVQ